MGWGVLCACMCERVFNYGRQIFKLIFFFSLARLPPLVYRTFAGSAINKVHCLLHIIESHEFLITASYRKGHRSAWNILNAKELARARARSADMNA